MLYFALSFDPTILQTIREILRVQSKPTKDTEEKAKMLLDYVSTYSNAIIRYKSSDMVLHKDSEAEYITMPEARSCYAVHFYLSDWPSPRLIKPTPKRNGPIQKYSKTICNIISSSAEVETCGTFNNVKMDIVM